MSPSSISWFWLAERMLFRCNLNPWIAWEWQSQPECGKLSPWRSGKNIEAPQGATITGGLREEVTPWAGAALLVVLYQRAGVEINLHSAVIPPPPPLLSF